MILTSQKSVNAGPSNGTGEGVAHSKRWYVAMVRMHHEKKVAERLDKMGIENFVPVQQEIHQWSDRRKKVEAVLLPMMVFVHVDPKERMEVLSFSTVSRYMALRCYIAGQTFEEMGIIRYKTKNAEVVEIFADDVKDAIERFQKGE